MENKILIDWLTFSSKIHSITDLMDLLGFDHSSFTCMTGRYGYRFRMVFGSISILYDGTEDMGVCVEMSGQGCRDFESFGSGDYQAIFDEIIRNPGDMRITRLDIAFDDFTGLLDIDTVCDDARSGAYVSRWDSRKTLVTYSQGGNSIQFGSRSSEMYLRIYDKAAERGYDDGRHWVRTEIVLKRERAMSFIYDNPELPIGDKFCGVLAQYLRFIDEDETDSNKWRWPIKQYWADFLSGAAPISLYSKPGTEYNLSACERYVYQQAGNAVWSLLLVRGFSGFFEDLLHRGTAINIKYKHLLATNGIVDELVNFSAEDFKRIQDHLSMVREQFGQPDPEVYDTFD